ncbi:MAG TPA: hypothetical protein VK206_06640, partial [Anaerolineales bacterium]|nr:hypothetical protein [Anaerolineales bacterium]
MNTKLSPNHNFKRVLMNILSLFVILVIALPVIQIARAATSSPFLGQWQTTDINGSDIRLTISGPRSGPLQITWTESYISSCDGQAGIVRGTVQLNGSDPNLLEADLHLACLTNAAAPDFHFIWRYHPLTNTLSGRYDNEAMTVWHRLGQSLPLPAALNLRVNYGDNWVESFYEVGHKAWITVTESNGVTIKATAELTTEAKDYWEGQPGFQSMDSIWLDAGGNPMENPPDIQPYDWVFGWLDNGASTQVQIGEIRGVVSLTIDSIEGTILAPWITDPIRVECLDWGSGENPLDNKDGGSILTNGTTPYSCSWAGEWDIQPGQNVGVGYFDPEENWVFTRFFTANPTFSAYVPSVIEGYDWPMGSTIAVNINDGEYTAQAVSEQRPGSPTGVTHVLFELWRNNFSTEAGDHIVMTDGLVTKEVTVPNLAVTAFDVSAGTISGVYDPGYDLWVWLYDREGQIPATDTGNGTWIATFNKLQAGAMGGARQQDTDGDRVSIDFQVSETLFVTSTIDVIANDGVCTLREATIAANTNAPSGSMSGECPAGMNSQTDTIVLVAGNTYSLTTDRTNNDTEADGDLDIGDNSSALDLIIKVEGDGKATVSQDASSVDDRVLENHGATMQIENLIIRSGSNVGGGGGVLNNGTLDIHASEISGNSVGWDGGGIWNGPGAALSLNSCVITGNYSDVFGGGIMNKGRLTVNNSEIRGNSTPVKGGGIANEGTLIVDNGVLAGNSADQGGALYNTGTTNIVNTTVGGPRAEDANSADGGGGLFSVGTMTVSDSTITGNHASYGGGLFNWTGGMLIISNSIVSNNTAEGGGGLHNKEGSTAIIQNNTIFSGNYAKFSGGGIENWGTITITDSVLRENTSPGEAGSAITSGVFEDSKASLTGSCIVGNGNIAVSTNLTTPLNAAGNWWGSHSGPAHRTNPGGIGDSVSD